MVLFLFSIAAACLLVTLAQGMSYLVMWIENPEKFVRRAKKTARTARRFTGLPDREEVKNIYSLSEQFADRLQEVVRS